MLHIGHYNYVNKEKIYSINKVDTNSSRRIIKEAKMKDLYIESNRGREVLSIVITDKYVYASSVNSKTLIERWEVADETLSEM